MIAGKYVELFALGIRNMRGYILRSILTVLGISIGIGSVIAMFATGEGAQQEILAQIGQLGIRNIIINSVKPSDSDEGGSGGMSSWISHYGLTFKDQRQIARTVPTAQTVLPVHTLYDMVWQGSRRVDARIHGVLPEHMELLQLELEAGRALSPVDNLRLHRVCIVRPGLLRALGYFGEPIGHTLQVGDTFYEIVGVLVDEEFTGLRQKALNADNRSLEIYVPYETVIRRHGTLSIVRKSGSFTATDVELNQIVVEVDDQDNVLATARMIERILDKFHKDHDYELIVPLELLAQRKKTQQVFNRHREHHARDDHGADPRDRRPPRPRSQEAPHRRPVPDGDGDPLRGGGRHRAPARHRLPACARVVLRLDRDRPRLDDLPRDRHLLLRGDPRRPLARDPRGADGPDRGAAVRVAYGGRHLSPLIGRIAPGRINRHW